jgi:hypothetical protein
VVLRNFYRRGAEAQREDGEIFSGHEGKKTPSYTKELYEEDVYVVHVVHVVSDDA